MAKGIKTEKDLSEISQILAQTFVEAALDAELDEHLGCDKHATSDTENSRNDVSRKQLQTEDGTL